jgi:hypothetical protein
VRRALKENCGKYVDAFGLPHQCPAVETAL